MSISGVGVLTGIPYPQVADTSHATPSLVAFMKSYFTAKTNGDIEGIMGLYSKESVLYIDAIIGWAFPSWDILHGAYVQNMPGWKQRGARSYPVRIVGGDDSAVVTLHDTREMFGEELFGIAAITMKDGKLARWVDYWDGRQLSSELRTMLMMPLPTEYRDDSEGKSAAPASRRVCSALHAALSRADIDAALDLFSQDAILEDLALRTILLGQARIRKYLESAVNRVPYAAGSTLVNIVGGTAGGAYEWRGAPDSGFGRGITAVELEADERISRLTTAYDTVPVSAEKFRELVLLAAS